tara:strand:- start:1109 stop:1630 length:522 start_codon:yes stop_codon:yes gene_type:complete
MKKFKLIREEFLSEAKVNQSKVKAGDKVEIHAKGALAKRSGFKKGDNPFGEGVKVTILGLAVVPWGKPANKNQVIAKGVDDFKKKYAADIKELKSDDNFDRSLSQYNSVEKIHELVTAVGEKTKKWKPGYTTINFVPEGGEYKGKPQYTYISSSIYGKWSIYWADDMEYDFIK